MAKEHDDLGCIYIIIVATSVLVSILVLPVWQAMITIFFIISVPILLYKIYLAHSKDISKTLRLCFFYSPTILLIELCAEFGYIIFRDELSLTELYLSTSVLSVIITLLFLFCISWSLSFLNKAIITLIYGTVSTLLVSFITSYVVPSYVFITNENLMPKHLHIEKSLSNLTFAYWGKTYYVNKSGKTLYIYKTTCTYYKDKYNDDLVDIPFPQNAQLEKWVYFPEDFHLYETPPRELTNQRIHYYIIDENTYKAIRKDECRKIVKCNHRH